MYYFALYFTFLYLFLQKYSTPFITRSAVLHIFIKMAFQLFIPSFMYPFNLCRHVRTFFTVRGRVRPTCRPLASQVRATSILMTLQSICCATILEVVLFDSLSLLFSSFIFYFYSSFLFLLLLPM